jgi:putative ABC transport system permease protein
MGIYSLPLKNLRRNRLRNLSTILRITLGVIILLILVSSGLGITSFLAKSGASNGNIIYGNQTNQTANSSQVNLVSELVSYFNSVLGSNFSENQLLNRVKDLIINGVYLIDLIASVALLFGVLNIMNVMGFNLSERRREIGLLKTMGFTKRQILISITLEAGILGFIGALVGVVLGILGIWFISKIVVLGLFTILLPPWLVLMALGITTILSLILGLYPAWFSSELDVEEALLCEY